MTFAKQIFSSIHKYNSTAFFICIVIFAFTFNVVTISAQDKKPLKLKKVISQIKENSAEENKEKLVKEICERGVDFALTVDNEKSLRDAGAYDLLIKVIREKFEVQKEKESLYELFADNYQGPDIKKIKLAVKAGRDYLKKFENSECYPDDPLIPYFKENLPVLEQVIEDEEKPKPPNCCPPKPDGNQIVKFTKAVENKKWDELFLIGAEILESNPKFLDIAIILAKVGYEQAVKEKQKSKYDEKAIYYAELSINLMEQGVKSDTEKYGANFGKKSVQFFQYKTKDFPDGKSNALGWMNYIIGYVKYFRLDQKDEAIPYFQKSTEYKSEVANFPETYTIIGDWYFEKFTAETGAEKQYAERAVEAYKRAFDLAKSDSKAEIRMKLKKLSDLGFGKVRKLNEINQLFYPHNFSFSENC